MTILLENTGKQFERKWIFRGINYRFATGNAYAVTGKNGSGKSTLLKLISGYSLPTEGKIIFSEASSLILPELIYRYFSICSPHIELIEDLTLYESIAFHGKFKKFINNMSVENVMDIAGLRMHKNKPVRNFSSGMKQRLQIALAVLSDASVLLLDEPLANLDTDAREWYFRMMDSYSRDRIVMVTSNLKAEECKFCREELKMEEFYVIYP